MMVTSHHAASPVRRSSPRLSLALSAVLALWACSDDGLQSAIGDLRVLDCNEDNCQAKGVCATIPEQRAALDFGNVPAELVGTRRLTLMTANRRPLRIGGLSIPAEDTTRFNIHSILIQRSPQEQELIDYDQFAAFTIEEDERAEVILRFRPADAARAATTLTIDSNDQDTPRVTVELRGGGGDLQVCVVDEGGSEDCSSDGRAIAYGTREIASRTTRDVVLHNLGQSDIVLTSASLAPGSSLDFLIQGPGCVRIPPASSDLIQVTYNPADGGSDAGVLQIGSQDYEEPLVEIALSGRAVGPRLCAAPNPIDFGRVVELTTARIPLRIWNCGLEWDLTISNVALMSGTSARFGLDADPDTVSDDDPWVDPGPLAPGAEVYAVVRYSPELAANLDAGFVRIDSNDPRSSIALVEIFGRGHPTPRCELVSAPEIGDFGWVARDEAEMGCELNPLNGECIFGDSRPKDPVSRRIEIRLRNKGELGCHGVRLGAISKVVTPTGMLDSAWGVQLDELAAALGSFDVDAASESVPIGLIFWSKRPPNDDLPGFVPPEYLARLRVYAPDHGFLPDPAPPETVKNFQVNLTATAGGDPACKLDIEAMSGGIFCGGLPGQQAQVLNFGAVNIGNAKMLPLRMRNIGALPCRVKDIGRLPGTSSDFAFSTAPFDVPVGSTGAIEITLTPRPADPNNPFAILNEYMCMTNQIMFNSESLDDQGALMGDQKDYLIGLQGKATIPAIDVIPGRVAFGEVALACCSANQQVRIYNSGTGDLTINSIRIDPASDQRFVMVSPASFTGPYTLVPGAPPFEMTIKFCPTRVGDHYGMLVINSTDADTMDLSVSLHGIGTTDSQGDDSFLQPTNPQVDVLFVIDDSGSMSGEQQQIAQNFSSFIQSAISLQTDYHLGVILPEVESDKAGRLWHCGADRYITSTMPSSTQRSQFECNVRTIDANRPHSDAKEASLQGARKALDFPNHDPLTSNPAAEYNDGFLREAAKLNIIVVTDERDQSDGQPSLYVDFFRNLKGIGNPDLLTISAITGDPPNGCPVGSSSPTAEGNQYTVDAVNATGGQFQSICSPDWSGMLSNLGLDVFNARRQFGLSRPADPPTIQVTLCDGASCVCPPSGDFRCLDCCAACSAVPAGATNGWTFATDVNAVTLNGTFIPGPSSCLEIEYQAVCY